MIRNEFPVKPFAEIGVCVADGFDLKVIVEYFVCYVPGSFGNNTETNLLKRLNRLSVRFFNWASKYDPINPDETEETFVYNNFVLDNDSGS